MDHAHVYRSNRDGVLDAADTPVTGPVVLAIADTAWLLVAIEVPPFAAVRGTTDTLEVRATSEVDGSATDAVDDVLEVRDVGIVVNLTKTVDRLSATIGDVLTYTITYSASGPNTAANFEIRDPIPLKSSYVQGTLRFNGSSLTEATGDDAGHFDSGGNRVVFSIGSLSGGDSGTVSFQVRVDG